MGAQEDIKQKNEIYLQEIMIRCPQCSINKNLKIPKKVIDQSKQLTTISIPSKLCCEHSFQAFVDKNFKVRGYQTVDFEFSNMEFYESSDNTYDTEDFTSTPIFQNIIKLLRECVDDKEIIGSGIFTIEGKVLYSSLPQTTLFNTIREFEVRNKKNLISVKKMYLELENNEKFISNIIAFNGKKFNLVLMFAFQVKFGMGNLHMRDLLKKIKRIQ
ncbi:MAG: hypothetical protein ACFFC3_08255 [Candidatus Odinarchaeota archaeon]